MASVREETARDLLIRASEAMGISGAELARRHGVATKTVGRWLRGQSSIGPFALGQIASLVYPHDRELAARMHAYSIRECTRIGVPLPPPLPIPPTPPTGEAGAPTMFVAPPSSRVDALVCAACEAIDVSPRVLRPALLAAFRAARELHLTVDEVEQHLAPRAKRKKTEET